MNLLCRIKLGWTYYLYCFKLWFPSAQFEIHCEITCYFSNRNQKHLHTNNTCRQKLLFCSCYVHTWYDFPSSGMIFSSSTVNSFPTSCFQQIFHIPHQRTIHLSPSLWLEDTIMFPFYFLALNKNCFGWTILLLKWGFH